ncbi:MAG: tape measure protein [Verrucomicrobiales bacterium]
MLETALRIDPSQFGGGLRQASADLRSFTRELKTSGQAGGSQYGAGVSKGVKEVAIGSVIADWLKSGLNHVRDIGRLIGREAVSSVQEGFQEEQLEIRFAVLAGGSEKGKEFLTSIQQQSEDTGRSVEAMTSSITKFLANGMDVAGAKKLNDALLDISGTLGLTEHEANLLGSAVAQVKAKGVASMEELRQQIAERGVPIFEALAESIGVSVPELLKMIKAGDVAADTVLDAFSNLEGAFARFRGGAERNAATGQGSVDRLKQSYIGLKREFGAPVADALKPALDSGISLIRSMKGEAGQIGKTIAASIQTGTAVVQAVGVTGIAAMVTSAFMIGLKDAANFAHLAFITPFELAGVALVSAINIGKSILDGLVSVDYWEIIPKTFKIGGELAAASIRLALAEMRSGFANYGLGSKEGAAEAKASALSDGAKALGELSGLVNKVKGTAVSEVSEIIDEIRMHVKKGYEAGRDEITDRPFSTKAEESFIKIALQMIAQRLGENANKFKAPDIAPPAPGDGGGKAESTIVRAPGIFRAAIDLIQNRDPQIILADVAREQLGTMKQIQSDGEATKTALNEANREHRATVARLESVIAELKGLRQDGIEVPGLFTAPV